MSYQIDQLLENCKKIVKSVAKAVKFGPKGPEPHLPTWSDRGHARGRLAWGEYREIDPVTNEVYVKKKHWAIPSLARTPMTKAIHKYWSLIGLPAFEAGRPWLSFTTYNPHYITHII